MFFLLINNYFDFINKDFYLIISILCPFIIFICILLLKIPFFLIYLSSFNDLQKKSPYECGFEPFNDARNQVKIYFFLVGILFLIFDLEIVLLLPWSICFINLDFLSFFSMLIFLLILSIGFAYEWKKKALDW